MPWPSARVGDVATIDRIGVDPRDIPSGTPYVGLENIECGGRLVDVSPTDSGQLASTKFRFSEEHVLFGKLRPNLAKVAQPTFAGVCSTDILPIRTGADLDRRYLAHWLLMPETVALASSRATGANLPRLSPAELLRFTLPLPPIQEQRRIADILDCADALRAKRRETLTLLDDLTQSIFLDMFGELEESIAIGDLVMSTQYGTSAKASTQGRWPVLRMGNITAAGRLDLTDLKYLDLTPTEVTKYTVRCGDLLFNRTNSADLVGKTCVVDTDDPLAFAGYLVRVRFECSATATFVSGYLNSRRGKNVLRGMAKAIIGQANINATEMRSIRVPDVPLAGQKEYAEQVDAVNLRRAAVQHAQAVDEELFASLQQRAFAGEL